MSDQPVDPAHPPEPHNLAYTQKVEVTPTTVSAIAVLRSKDYFPADKFPPIIAMAQLLTEIADSLKAAREKPSATYLRAMAQILRHLNKEFAVMHALHESLSPLTKELNGLISSVKTNAEVLNATASTYTRLTDNAVDIHKNLESACLKISSHSVTAAPQQRSYSQAVTSQSSNPSPSATQDSVTRKIQNRHAVQYRQFVISFKENATDTPRDSSPETTLQYKTKISEALTTAAEGTIAEPAIRSASILRSGGILFEVKDVPTAKWIRDGENKEKVATAFHPDAFFRERTFPLIARFVPVDWTPEDPDSLRDLEAAHDIAANSIREATWIKNPTRRSAGQDVAHIKISCTTPESANTLLTSAVWIGGRQVTVTKDSKEPTRCNKCQKYGHFAVDCKEEKDACGKCGKEHRTVGCTATETWCVSCNTASHPSISRDCPQFSKRANSLYTANPEATLPYFPTDEPWTWERAPPPKRTQTRRVDLAPVAAPQERRRTKQTTLNFGINSIPLPPGQPRFPRVSQPTQPPPSQAPLPANPAWFSQQPAIPPYMYAQQPHGVDPVAAYWSDGSRPFPSASQPGPSTPSSLPPGPASLPVRPFQTQPSHMQTSNSQPAYR
jgi:hypothetical protein